MLNSQIKFVYIDSGAELPQNRDPFTVYVHKDAEHMYIGDVRLNRSDIDNIYATLQTKADKTIASNITDGLMSSTDKVLLDNVSSAGISHNSIFRGKDLGTEITEAQQAAIRDGTFDDIYIGDYWTLPTESGSTTHRYVVSKLMPYSLIGVNVANTPFTGNSVLLLSVIAKNQQMSESSIEGGYLNSEVRTIVEGSAPQYSTSWGVRRCMWPIDNSIGSDNIVNGNTTAMCSGCLLSEIDIFGRRVVSRDNNLQTFSWLYPIPYISFNSIVGLDAESPRFGDTWLRDLATVDAYSHIHVGTRVYDNNLPFSNAEITDATATTRHSVIGAYIIQ